MTRHSPLSGRWRRDGGFRVYEALDGSAEPFQNLPSADPMNRTAREGLLGGRGAFPKRSGFGTLSVPKSLDRTRLFP